MDGDATMRICLDTETTGLHAGDDEILTLSIADLDRNELYRGMFRPQVQTEWPFAEKINGISPDTVADCPAIDECVAEIQGIIDSASEIYGYNVMFDAGFLRAAGIEIPQAKLHDTMMDFAGIRAHELDLPSVRRFKLVDAATVAEHSWGDLGAHDAMEDVQATITVQKWCDAMRASIAGPADDPEGLLEAAREKWPSRVDDQDALLAVSGHIAWIGNPEAIEDTASQVDLARTGEPVQILSDSRLAASALADMLARCWDDATRPEYLNPDAIDLPELAKSMGLDHAETAGRLDIPVQRRRKM